MFSFPVAIQKSLHFENRAFLLDPHINWLVEQSNKSDKIKALLTYNVYDAFENGYIFMTKDKLAVALWYSNSKKQIFLEQ